MTTSDRQDGASCSMDLDLDDLIHLSAVPALLPKAPSGRELGRSAIWRWTRGGCNGVRLRSVRIGRSVYTSREWLSQFIAARSKQEPPARSHGRRRCDHG